MSKEVNKTLMIAGIIIVLLGILYFGAKGLKTSMMNSSQNQSYMQNGQSADTMTDSQDDQSLSQISLDDNADLSDNSGL